ncbi:hypothetical protein ACP4OV_010321 [Aristida adscensionis]
MDGGGEEHGGGEEETSAARRGRLLALRSAAASHSAASPPPARAGSLLPDPDLAAAGDTQPSAPRPPHRFHYYTDPAAAFSSSAAAAHKRKSPAPYNYSPAPPPPPPPPYAEPGSYPQPKRPRASSPTHYPSPLPPVATGSSPWPSPTQFQTPKPEYQGTPMAPPIWPSPMQFQIPMSGYQGNPGAPPPWGPPHYSSSVQVSCPNSSSFGFRNAEPHQRVSLMNYGPRGRIGTGRSHNYGHNLGSRGIRGRGGASRQNHSEDTSFQNLPELQESMVDDPWKEFHPIVGNILVPRELSLKD